MTDTPPPTEHALPSDPSIPTSLLLVNTGDGKGKSTAAFGTMLRALARGWDVAVIQFIKSGDWKSGEETIARRLGVDWHVLGDGFSWDADDLEKSAEIASDAWALARRILDAGDHGLLILDEITYPMNWDWIDTDEVVSALDRRPAHVNVVATGRDAPQPLIDLADTVTEMVKVRHPYDRGLLALRGIDF